MHAQPHRPLRRGVGTAALLAAALCLCACGSATSGATSGGSRSPTPGSSPTTIGSALNHLERLVVTRSDAFPQNHLAFSFPARVTVSDPLPCRRWPAPCSPCRPCL